MPTRVDFELAAETFRDAAGQLGELTAAVEHVPVNQILIGGVLGHVVPTKIASSSAMVRACQVLVEDAAQECVDRAKIIADYETALERYDESYEDYERRSRRWQSRRHRYQSAPNEAPRPGSRPVAPTKPPPPPPWADVRRP